MKENIVFKLNKKNILIIIVIVLLSLTIGALFVLYSSLFISSFVRSEFFIKISGLIICMYSIPLLIGYLKLLVGDYGLILSNEGIVNNTNLTNLGIIDWKDIKEIKRKELKKNTIFLVFLKDDKKYFKRASLLKRINIWGYKSSYKTSIVIEPKNLLCVGGELELLLRKKLNT